MHKGNIMKFTEGAFAKWGYELAQREFKAELLDGGPWMKIKAPHGDIVLKDVIADAFLQQILLRPAEYDVIATMNLNGDYISDALAAQVGGIGIAPGANLSDSVAMFEATHGTAPKYAGKDYVNPGSEILSAEMMLRHMGWTEAADLSHQVDGTLDPVQEGHLRLRAPDGRRHPGQLLGLRAGDDRKHVASLVYAIACAHRTCTLGGTVRALREPLKTDLSAALRSGRALRRRCNRGHSTPRRTPQCQDRLSLLAGEEGAGRSASPLPPGGRAG